ncbi:polarized growth protein Boi2 [Aspergillus heteromorphus CBS 117.55]|uniref:Polarized growth protein Boi2 n=1 Tax=Aspergillus heteromorphus CBS 117.55 TaxID=1448321 RepID=A0A317WXL5_9EURO|nr:polarized growth protein Boi2 [Aspergillus heteromorphus CBS 117.55]PWY91134.1 polarized growth protein Boi2 [Aspergillus heteromorphus CBS 117.55]
MALSAPPRGVTPGDLLLVVHDFDARGPDELTLRRGDKIELVELDDGFGDGWYLGKDLNTGSTGLFPGGRMQAPTLLQSVTDQASPCAVYTTTAPRIPVRQRADAPETALGTDFGTDSESSQLEIADPVSLPRSGESTPHVSRHTSASSLRAPDLQGGPVAPALSPKQPQRSSSSPLPASKMSVDIQQSMRQSGHHVNGQDSPVMNETLSVIDEHITDLSTPRHSVTAQEPKILNDSASEYSSHFEHRMSYINGHETDEEEENQPREEQVRRWTPAETAKQLRQCGVEDKHCGIFEEQEITGDVLLDMNQDFLFMKEFDFGVMGRRLKTWHKIRTFQDEVKGVKPPTPQPRGSVAAVPGPPEERAVSRASHTGPLLPRIPTLRGSSGTQHPRLVSSSMQSTTSSPITPQTPTYMDHSRRPSAASIREINHSRRHSSIDATNRYSGLDGSPGSNKRGSFDRGWTLTGGGQRLPTRPGTAVGTSHETGFFSQPIHHPTGSNGSDPAVVTDDLDRGYFSGPEGDLRKNRRLLQKRQSVTGSAESRLGNFPEEQLRVGKRHSRIGSVDSIRESAQQMSPLPKAHTTPAPKGRLRSLSTRMSDRRGQQSAPASAVEERPSGALSLFGPLFGKSESDSSRSTPLPQIKGAGPKFRRAMGLRAMSDVVAKGIDTSTPPPASPVRDNDPSSARTGSTTPSTSKSSERHSTDGSNKAAEGGLWPRSRPSVKANVKSKKDTSAYTRGLEKKTPQEQTAGCEYSGWMKKRSSNLMTTWKPRLFVLRGRRLSYYYSEQDTEERGLIDITAHRVLRADNDPIVALHATITGSTTSATPANAEGPPDKAASESRRGKTGSGPFFFKLVPPKSGTSRTVQFTKPAIHYFQVDSVQEGRLWMAALMKATIERDMELPVETTNKQRTVSLKEARQMNQRPPALMTGVAAAEVKEEPKEEEEQAEEAAAEETEREKENGQGLMIRGVDLDEEPESIYVDAEEKRLSNPLGGLEMGGSLLSEMRNSR